MTQVNALRQRAGRLHRSGQLSEAEQAYRELLRRQPDPAVAANLGALLRGMARLEEAERHYRWALQQFPEDAALLANACNLFRDLGQAEATLTLLEAGLKRSPGHFGLRQGLALSLHHCGRVKDALALLPDLLREQPDSVNLLLEYGACLAKQEQKEQALTIFEKAQILEPSNPHVQANRISILTDLGQLDEALQLLEASSERGRHPRLIGAEAVLAMTRNDPDTAMELHRRLTQLEPHVADHWLHLANTQLLLRQMVAPLKALQQALKLAPQREDLQLMLGRLLVEHGLHQQGLALLRSGADHPEANDVIHSIFQFAVAGSRLVPAEELRVRAADWEQKRALKPSELWRDRIRDPDPDRRLKVGYLSPDYCNHPVGRFVDPLFSLHDRQQVEVVGLSCGSRIDHQHQRLQGLCDAWHDLRFTSDGQMARLLADLQLDVLVDLGGYTADQRLRPLTARPAPIQLSYLGYPASTFLSCMDGWIGDRVVFGPQQELEKGVNERLLCLPRCYLAFAPQEGTPEPDRSAPDQRFRFGSFNHSRKFSDSCLDLFAAVLQAVPDSLMVLKSITFGEPAERQRICARLLQRGIAAERLELLEWVPGNANHLELYSQMDAAIDTLPYSGTTTTCEALWMGVPVLTLLGEVMVDRQSAAVLAGADLGSAIARSVPDLLRRAQLLAARGPRQRAERLALREHVARSALLDSAGLARSLEGLYRQLWQERCLTDRL
jgi:protein O-GlcNAc transferase